MNTQDLIKQIKARFNLNYQKIQLKEKYESKLIFANQGGLWLAGPDLFSILSFLADDELIIVDLYKNPVKVKRTELYLKAAEVYKTVMLDWHKEFEELKNNR